jgi:hypothetical protein
MRCIQFSLQQAIDEIRKTSAIMGLPALDQIGPTKTLELVVQAHEQRTGTRVNLVYSNLPDKASLPSKITLYRVVQEGLNNSFRHAGGVGQQVVVARARQGMLKIEISDQGKGFDVNQEIDQSQHLGISGMCERVESLGGRFSIKSSPGNGTKVVAIIPLQTEDVLTNQFALEDESTPT